MIDQKRKTGGSAPTFGPGRHGDRGGFTLIELLVVIAIILLVSAVALPTVLPALSHRQVSEAARTLQAVLAGARDAAIRDNNPSGLRLMPDPLFSGVQPVFLADGITPNPTTLAGRLDPSLPLAYNRIIPIGPAPEYSEGFAQVLDPKLTMNAAAKIFTGATVNTALLYPVPNVTGGSTAGLTYPYGTLAPTNGSVLMVAEMQFGPNPIPNKPGILNPPTSWFWNIRVGDKIQFNNAGPWYTIVGPMAVAPMNPQTPGQNPEFFVNVGIPGTASPLALTQNGQAANPEFLFVVNGQDDNANGWVDEGWDGVDNNGNGLTDELAEWEPETFLGALATPNATETQFIYTIQRRPVPQINAREVQLPSGVVIDASGWSTGTNERTRVPNTAFNAFSGVIEIMINPDGSVVPTTLYSSPASIGMAGAFYHFWLAERGDVYAPQVNAAGTAVPLVTVANDHFFLPMPLSAISQLNPTAAITADAYAPLVAANPSLPVLKGELRIVTVFSKTGQLSTNENPTFNVNNVNQPFLEAQQGVSGGQQ
jgi:prepilin-type N-terminal cleavage/methylation domain-containing protein